MASLSAGVDLLLIAWDTDQVYAVLDALLRARAAGYVDRTMLQRSAERLDTRSTALRRSVPWFAPTADVILRR